MKTFNVDLDQRSYPIYIDKHLLERPSVWLHAIQGQHVLIVSNTTVAPLYLDKLKAQLAGFDQVAEVILPDGESHKTLHNINIIFSQLATMGAMRDATVIALGGGVIGDMAGFAAACWMRGIHFVQVPTTLLAMVDSSVGGKTGVNVPAGKNLVGAFHQPQAVIADTATLTTLPAREYHAGLAEAIKHSALGDAAFFAKVEAMLPALLERDEDALKRLIYHSCQFKAGVVHRDEKEHGERALLNFGHTFGHALETTSGYGVLLHGEAVAIGMCLASQLSSKLQLAPEADAQRLKNLLAKAGLPTTIPEPGHAQLLLEKMQLDKKNRAGKLRLILWRGLGKAELMQDIPDEAILACMQ